MTSHPWSPRSTSIAIGRCARRPFTLSALALAYLIPRSAGAVQIYDVENVQTRVYVLDPTTKVATPRFTLPGYLGGLRRLR